MKAREGSEILNISDGFGLPVSDAVKKLWRRPRKLSRVNTGHARSWAGTRSTCRIVEGFCRMQKDYGDVLGIRSSIEIMGKNGMDIARIEGYRRAQP